MRDNYLAVESVCELFYEQTKNSETRATIVGLQTQMEKIYFLFGKSLGFDIMPCTALAGHQ